MRSFLAFLKKELLESLRSGKLLILAILFFALGVMNPAIAKLTPWIMEMFADELAESGMIITEIKVDALTSWTQFFKNIPMGLIAFVFLYSGIFTKEYESETLVPILTKGLERHKVVIAKSLVMTLLWTVGYWLCFGVTYVYNDYFWDNGIALGLAPAVINWWIFGLFVIGLMILFSVVARSYSGVLLGTGGCVFASYLLGLLPKVAKYLPTSLMNSSALLVGAESADEYGKALAVTVVLLFICLVSSAPIFNKKRI